MFDENSGPRVVEWLEALSPGQAIPFGGDRVARVSLELAQAFKPGDRLVVVQETGDLLHIPRADQEAADRAVATAHALVDAGGFDPAAITAFYDAFAARLGDDSVWARIAEANAADVESARARGRTTTRLMVSDAMRRDMIEGVVGWRDEEAGERVLQRIDHAGWTLEQVVAPLGVVGFVFEGRPNVFADAVGVLRNNNTVVIRIGSDALGTARAIMAHAIEPAFAAAGLPAGGVTLVDSPSRASGWAMFSNPRLSLAVARGSGPAVAQLGAVARQSGIAVSLHGTGGAWLVADTTADADRFYATVFHSLDRKVCNTLNVCCIVADRADDLTTVFLEALWQAGIRRKGCKLHMVEDDFYGLPDSWRSAETTVHRAEGPVVEPLVEPISAQGLGVEWEWEETPEVTLCIVDDLDDAIARFNHYSPRLAATLISQDLEAQADFYRRIRAPFVGDGFTRWVDGQYALGKPELGLSNWEHGQLFGRSAVLSGDDVFTVRTRVRQTDPHLDRQGVPTPPRKG